MSLATQSHKHGVVRAKRDQPNLKPGNCGVNIYTLRLGLTHCATSGARPATEVQVLTVPFVVVQDFQPDCDPTALMSHVSPGKPQVLLTLLFPTQGCSSLSRSTPFDLSHCSPRDPILQPSLLCAAANTATPMRLEELLAREALG